MFEAELAGKLPDLASYEDYLTSCVFGALKYLPPGAGLLPLLYASTNHRSGISFGCYLERKNIRLGEVNEAQLLFWPRSSVYGEPDLVVILRGESESYIVPIEVKYFSGKHGEGEEDQLARYYSALATAEGRGTFSCEPIRQFSGELLALIYITQFAAEHEIEETSRELSLRGMGESRERIFHLRWQKVHEVVEELRFSECDPFRQKVLSDIRQLMRHKGLTPFKGFERLPRELSTEALLQFPVFFESEDIRRKRLLHFPALPDSLSREALSRRPVYSRVHDQQDSSFPGTVQESSTEVHGE